MNALDPSLRDRLDAAEPERGREAESPGREPLPIERFSDITPVLDGFWLVKKILPKTGSALIFGHPGTAKSFLALDLGFHIALGWDWDGHKVEQGLVVYVGAEGRSGLRNRVSAFKKHHQIGSEVPFSLIPSPIDLRDPRADKNRLIDAIRSEEQHFGTRPVLVVLDTLNKTFGGGDENGSDMAAYLNNCEAIATEFDCLIMPVHHRPRDSGNEGPRGHGSLRGGLDCIILVEGDELRTAKIWKQKDGEEGGRISFKLKPVTLGFDEDGDEVSSCIVEIVDQPGQQFDNPMARVISKLSDGQRIVWDQLPHEIQSGGMPVPDEIPSETINRNMVSRVASLDTFSDRCIAALRTGSDNKPDSVRRAYDRHIQRLQTKGLVGVHDKWIWSNV